jgi:hypothetical protein
MAMHARGPQQPLQWHILRLFITMKDKRTKNRPPALLAAAVISVLATELGPVQAQPFPLPGGGYSLAFNLNIGDNPAPAGTPAWLTALIKPISGGVSIDLLSDLQSPTEFITAVGFNLTQSIKPFNWTCDPSSQINCQSSKVDVIEDFNNAPKINFQNEAKGFDLAIYLPDGKNDNRLTGSEMARFNILAAGLTPELFLSTNTPSSPGSVTGLWSAARVQGTGPTGNGSTTIADPPGTSEVPGPLPWLGAGVALGFSRRLRQRLNLAQTA